MRSHLLRAVWPRGPGCTLPPLEGDRCHPAITVHLGAATPNRPDPGLPSCTSSFSTPKTDKNKQTEKETAVNPKVGWLMEVNTAPASPQRSDSIESLSQEAERD